MLGWVKMSESQETVPRPRALDAATLVEAFQVTAAEHAARTALRT
jgi:hypothetical protein